MSNLNNAIENILGQIEGTLNQKITDLTSDVKNRINESSTGAINKLQQKFGEYQAVGFAMYAIPVILLFYIVYLLTKRS